MFCFSSALSSTLFPCAESEELLSSLPTAQFHEIAISIDLDQLVVSTRENLLLLISLPDYFRLFPNHYHPSFASPPTFRRKESVRTSSKRINTSKEEGEDRIKYGGLSDRALAMGDTHVGSYVGNYAWSNRLDQLDQSVDRVQPGVGQHLNLHHSSTLSGGGQSRRLKKGGRLTSRLGYGVSEKRPAVDADTPWYEKPVSHLLSGHVSAMPQGDFDLHFITSLTRTSPRSQNLDVSDGTGSPESSASLKYSYQNHCLLPPAASIIDPTSSIVSVSVTSSQVVAYYGSKPHGESRSLSSVDNLEGSPIDLDCAAEVPVVGVAVYKTDTQYFTSTRYVVNWELT